MNKEKFEAARAKFREALTEMTFISEDPKMLREFFEEDWLYAGNVWVQRTMGDGMRAVQEDEKKEHEKRIQRDMHALTIERTFASLDEFCKAVGLLMDAGKTEEGRALLRKYFNEYTTDEQHEIMDKIIKRNKKK